MENQNNDTINLNQGTEAPSGGTLNLAQEAPARTQNLAAGQFVAKLSSFFKQNIKTIIIILLAVLAISFAIAFAKYYQMYKSEHQIVLSKKNCDKCPEAEPCPECPTCEAAPAAAPAPAKSTTTKKSTTSSSQEEVMAPPAPPAD